jgi:hypothetical protein
MNRTILLRCFGRPLAIGLLVGLGALATGCRSFENAGASLDNGLRNTGQDLQHGIRGEPDPSTPPPPATAAQPQQPAQPATPQAPAQPATAASGVAL